MADFFAYHRMSYDLAVCGGGGMSVQGWFLVMIFCVIAELLTGTLFLLLIGVSALVGLFVASLGYGVVQQTSVAFLCSVVLLAFFWRRRAVKPALLFTTDFNQGAPVQIIRWISKSRARVFYRGTEWDAELVQFSSEKNDELQQNHKNDEFFVHHLEGNVLFIDTNPVQNDQV